MPRRSRTTLPLVQPIVAKRKTDPYSPETTWYKIKNRAYTQAEGRWELFNRKA
jgi:hypothetical protein